MEPGQTNERDEEPSGRVADARDEIRHMRGGNPKLAGDVRLRAVRPEEPGTERRQRLVNHE